MPRALRVVLPIAAVALVFGVLAGLALDSAASGSAVPTPVSLEEVEADLFTPEAEEMSGDPMTCPTGQFGVDCVIEADPCGRRFEDWACCPNGSTVTCEPVEIPGSLCYMGVQVVCT